MGLASLDSRRLFRAAWRLGSGGSDGLARGVSIKVETSQHKDNYGQDMVSSLLSSTLTIDGSTGICEGGSGWATRLVRAMYGIISLKKRREQRAKGK